MSKGNGSTTIHAKELSDSDKLNVLIEALADIADQVQALNDRLDETNEKLSNLSLDGDGFQVERYGES